MDGKKLKHPRLLDFQIPEKVAEIMDRREGEWRLDNFEQWISKEECKAIRTITICQEKGRDTLVWPFTKNGEYSVMTGYYRMKKEDLVVENGFIF